MGMKNSQQDAVAHLEARLGKDQASAATAVRLLKLITRVVEHWHSDECLNDVSSLSDAELLQRILISDAVTECLPSREQRKRNRRTASRLDVLIKLKDFGGLMKIESVAELLGVSRQTVNNDIHAGKLIALKDGNDYLIPGFQFDGHEKLKHFEEVLRLIDDASPEAKCSFFLNPVLVGNGRQELPYALLKRGAIQRELDGLTREAQRFLSPAAD